MQRRTLTLGTVTFMQFFLLDPSELPDHLKDVASSYVVVKDCDLPEELREDHDTEVVFGVYSIDAEPAKAAIILVEDIDMSEVNDELAARIASPIGPEFMHHGAQVFLRRRGSTDDRIFRLGRMKQGGQMATSLSDRQKLKEKKRQAAIA